jgi:hypothetical protein
MRDFSECLKFEMKRVLCVEVFSIQEGHYLSKDVRERGSDVDLKKKFEQLASIVTEESS